VQAVLAASGYDAVIVMNREGADACNAVTTSITRRSGHSGSLHRSRGWLRVVRPHRLRQGHLSRGDGTAAAPIPVGTVGDVVTDVGGTFDGWNYVHLFAVGDDLSLTDVDTFAIPEAMDPNFASDFGDLQGRGALRRELTACLRTGRALRVRRARTRGRGKKFVTTPSPRSRTPSTAAPQDPRLEDPCRSAQRSPSLASNKRCCIDPLNPGWGTGVGVMHQPVERP
jgi:hypothetical protein